MSDVEAAVETPEVAPEVPVETVAEAAPEVKAEEVAPEEPKEEPKKTPWFLQRIGEETNKRRAAETKAEQAERELREAKELLSRLQTPQERPEVKERPSNDDIQKLVKEEAARQRFVEDTVAIRNAGLKKFSDFNDTLHMLTSLGVTSDDFVQDVMAVDKDNAHVILDALAKDPERAISLLGMDSRRRTVELTRIADKMSEPVKVAPKPSMSKAPAPKPALEPVTEPEVDAMSDKSSDDEWSRAWDKKYKKRA